MKEFVFIVLSFIKVNSENLGIDFKIFEEKDIYLYVFEGVIFKDGLLVGIIMFMVLIFVFIGKWAKIYVAMIGEIILCGKVLFVGGIKEKILVVKWVGMKEIIFCQENEKYVVEINLDYINGIEFYYVSCMEEVLNIMFGIWQYCFIRLVICWCCSFLFSLLCY